MAPLLQVFHVLKMSRIQMRFFISFNFFFYQNILTFCLIVYDVRILLYTFNIEIKKNKRQHDATRLHKIGPNLFILL